MAAASQVFVVLISTLLALPAGVPHLPDERCWMLSELSRQETRRRLRQPAISPSMTRSNRWQPRFISCAGVDTVRAITLGFATAAMESGMAVRWSVEGRARYCEAQTLSLCIPLADPAAWPLTADQRLLLAAVWTEVRAVMASGPLLRN